MKMISFANFEKETFYFVQDLNKRKKIEMQALKQKFTEEHSKFLQNVSEDLVCELGADLYYRRNTVLNCQVQFCSSCGAANNAIIFTQPHVCWNQVDHNMYQFKFTVLSNMLEDRLISVKDAKYLFKVFI